MKIQLAEHYGLCFGVRDAIAQAEQLAREGPLTILGELVHNPVVRERLMRHGVREGGRPVCACPDFLKRQPLSWLLTSLPLWLRTSSWNL